MRGRGTRKVPHIGKIGFTMSDFVGVADFHGDDGDIEGGFVREPRAVYRAGDPRIWCSGRPVPPMRHPANARKHGELAAMPMTPELRRGIDRIRDYLFGGGYPNPAQNAEQLSFLIYFYMYEAADAARLRAAQRPGAAPYSSAFAGEWTLRNPRNARDPGQAVDGEPGMAVSTRHGRPLLPVSGHRAVDDTEMRPAASRTCSSARWA